MMVGLDVERVRQGIAVLNSVLSERQVNNVWWKTTTCQTLVKKL